MDGCREKRDPHSTTVNVSRPTVDTQDGGEVPIPHCRWMDDTREHIPTGQCMEANNSSIERHRDENEEHL